MSGYGARELVVREVQEIQVWDGVHFGRDGARERVVRQVEEAEVLAVGHLWGDATWWAKQQRCICQQNTEQLKISFWNHRRE